MKFEEVRKRAAAAWERFTAPGDPLVLIGAGTCGRAAGGDELLEVAGRWKRESAPEATICEVGCLGMCYAEPLVELGIPDGPRILYGDVTADKLCELLESVFTSGDLRSDMALAVTGEAAAEGIPRFSDLAMIKGQVRIATRNCGVIDPENIDHYIARGGYAGLAKALAMSPDEVIEEVKRSGLRGRGGAGFPTGVKWGFCRKSPGETKYMVCNADEGDPGAFMDRAVLESDPHSILEGMIIAAWAIGAGHGYVYARAEYPLAVGRLERAIGKAEEYGLLGDDILGSGFGFHIKIKEGAGAFVCGEETALLASIEGRRGMPRPRPPFPAQKGLFGKPTNINNVETLANVPAILERGADWFAQYGTEKSRGTKTFALAGKIERTGLIEVPLGITLGEIVDGIGGGVPGGRGLKAVQTGGPSGGCIPASMLDLPVDYERLATAGSIMGSGGMVVMDENTCMVDIARYFLEFTQQESCGKCAPCRLGTKQMLRILEKICAGEGEIADLDLLGEIGSAVKKGALCGLGQTAPNPVLTTISNYRDEYEAHILEKRCPAGTCQALINFSIDAGKCICCSRCAKACPVDCITGKAGKPPAKATDEDRKKGKAGEPFRIDQEACIKCGTCQEVCPADAVIRE